MALNSKTNSVDDVVLQGVMKVVSSDGSSWRGTMTELNSNLNKVLKTNSLPGSPSALRVVLNRITNRLRSRGVSIRFGRTTDRMRTRFVRFVR